MSRPTDWVTVPAGPEGPVAVARALLALAEDRSHVRTANAGNEFLVPPYLADLYVTPPAPKRRRTKKEEESADGN